MRTLIVLASLAAVSVANAQTTTITRSPGQTVIETRPLPGYMTGPVNPGPFIVYVPKPTDEDIARSRAREAAWRERCNPTLSAPDPNTGVRRYLYAAPGCEFGD